VHTVLQTIADVDVEAKPKNWITRHRRILLIGGPVLALAVAFVFYITGGRYESTDDASFRQREYR
jgi:membrane fusion protein (multidrug efflux system)